VFALSLFVGTASAQPSTDWRFYGATKIGPDESAVDLFYLNNEIRRTPDGHLLVWTKGLALKRLMDENEKADADRIDRAARKVMTGYVPPIFKGEKHDQDQVVGAISFEEMANEAKIEPTTRILYEIDCATGTSRELSIEIHINGELQSKNEPRPWSHIPPESNGSSLFAAVCEGIK
jgi:hypothetical protein